MTIDIAFANRSTPPLRTRCTSLRDMYRLRDGAIRWGIFQDTAQPERFVETFVVESWLEFLRERERMTTSDRIIRDRAHSFHQGDTEPLISFMIYARENA